MNIKNISWPSLLIGAAAGFVLGALVLGFFVNYVVKHALSSSAASGPLSGVIAQVREGIANDSAEQKTQVAYGKVVSNQNGMLTLNVYRQNKYQDMSFTYDDSTSFVTYSNDNTPVEIRLSSDSIAAGDRVTVYTNEPIGSVTPQHAVKAIKN